MSHSQVGNRVFRYGDYGDKFYIICEGTVSVHIPIKIQSKEDQQIFSCKPLKFITSANKEKIYGGH